LIGTTSSSRHFSNWFTAVTDFGFTSLWLTGDSAYRFVERSLLLLMQLFDGALIDQPNTFLRGVQIVVESLSGWPWNT
jgi:hypothetical protein